MIKVGESVPDNILYTLSDNTPKATTVHDLFKGKKVIVFGLPGAFTTVCSSKQVPEYYERIDELRSKGISEVYCVSVNDPFVMHHWALDLKIDESRLPLLSDGNASWHSKMGLTQHLEGLGTRAIRYSMVIDDLKVICLNVEDIGPTCYRVSGPQTLLNWFNKASSSK